MSGRRRFPGLLQRIWVLWKMFDRGRLLAACDVVRRGGLTSLLSQLTAHTSYRWQLHERSGSYTIPTPEPHLEDVFPANCPLVSVIVTGLNNSAFVAEAVAIKRLRADPALHARMREATRRLAEQELSIKHMIC
jgi:hypothetical protein